MHENFILVSLEESKSKKIAEVISNTTARKILDALAEKEYTESELATQLKIPISTVHYNIKQLIEANLVVVDEFHYSSKGKEVNHYKLANKFIIIAPKSQSNQFMDALKKIIPLLGITVVTGAILGIAKVFLSSGAKMSASVAQDAAPELMMAKAATFSAPVEEVSRPFLQSEMIAWFFIGALSVTIIYFLYELVRKKK